MAPPLDPFSREKLKKCQNTVHVLRYYVIQMNIQLRPSLLLLLQCQQPMHTKPKPSKTYNKILKIWKTENGKKEEETKRKT